MKSWQWNVCYTKGHSELREKINSTRQTERDWFIFQHPLSFLSLVGGEEGVRWDNGGGVSGHSGDGVGEWERKVQKERVSLLFPQTRNFM